MRFQLVLQWQLSSFSGFDELLSVEELPRKIFIDRLAWEFLRNGEADEASALSCCNVLSGGNLSRRPVAGILSKHQPGHVALAEHRCDFDHVDCTGNDRYPEVPERQGRGDGSWQTRGHLYLAGYRTPRQSDRQFPSASRRPIELLQ